MNQELGEFFVKFTTQGLTEVKDAINDLSKKMDDVGTSAKSATDKSDSFFANIGKGGKWFVALTGFTGAVVALKKAWDSVANAAAATMTIYNQAMLAGTDPKTLERWQNVARHKGLNAAEIFSDFRNGREFLTRFGDLEISEEFNKVFARANLTSDAVIASLERGNMDELFRMLNTALSARDASGNALVNETRAKDVLSQIGFGDTMLSLLRLQTLPDLLANARLVYTENPETLRASVERTEARETLRDSWNAIWANPEFIDTQTKLLNTLNEMMPYIEDIAKWCAKAIGEIVGTQGETEAEQTTGTALKIAGAITGGILSGGPVGAAIGAHAGTKANDWLLKQDWYKNMVNNVAPKDFWTDYNAAIAAGNYTQWPGEINVAGGDSNATAVVNVNGYTVTKSEGKGYTKVELDLNEIPDMAVGG